MSSSKPVAESKQEQREPSNLIERLFSSLFGGDDPERQKRRQLKAIGKRLNKGRYKFYKPRMQLAQPGLARFFFDIYQVVGPAQKLLHNARNSAALRQIVIEHFFTDEQAALRANLTEEAIRELAGKREPQDLARVVKNQLQKFYASFENDTVRRINETNQRLHRMVDLVSFDYFFFLRKFDGSFPEDGFNAKPKFESINAAYVCDDLKDFLEVFEPLPADSSWDDVLAILEEYRNVPVVNAGAWRKLVGNLARVRDSGVIVDIVRHAEENPWFEPDHREVSARTVEPYLEKVKREAEQVIHSIFRERRQNKIDRLTTEVFGTNAIMRTKNYTEKASSSIAARAQTRYVHTDAMNYLKAFLIDYFKKDIRELQDMLVVRGQWASSHDEQQMSAAFHRLMELAGEVVQFDDELGEEGKLGMKLRRALGRSVANDPGSQKLALQAVEEINGMAGAMISESAQKLVIIGQSLKSLIEDYGKRKPEMINNWREIEGMSEQPIKERMTEVYKRIYYFVQLLQMFQKKQKKSDSEEQKKQSQSAGT
ncbi:MAG: DUF5312 family protein [Spirochaetales bacterium]